MKNLKELTASTLLAVALVNVPTASAENRQFYQAYNQYGYSYKDYDQYGYEQYGIRDDRLFKHAKGRSAKKIESSPMMQRLREQQGTVWASAIDLNMEMMQEDTDSMMLNLGPGVEYMVYKDHSYAVPDQSPDAMVWVGKVDMQDAVRSSGFPVELLGKTNSMLMYRDGDRVTANIDMGKDSYRITTTEDGRGYMMSKFDKTLAPQVDFSNDVFSERDVFAENASKDRKQSFVSYFSNKFSNKIDGLSQGIADMADSFVEFMVPSVNAEAAMRTIRVLIGATPNAIRELGGANRTLDRMNMDIAQANLVMANGGMITNNIRFVSAQNRIQQTAAERPRLNGAGVHGRTIAGLENLSDGYLDYFAISVRNRVRADLVGLIVPSDTGSGQEDCGIASEIGAEANEAFFTVGASEDCFQARAFIHEIGHLFGARHDDDPLNTPFRFGHGHTFSELVVVTDTPEVFEQDSIRRGTVMVATRIDRRIDFLSAFQQTFAGEDNARLPLGVGGVSNVVRVFREQAPRIQNFRP